MILSDAFLDGMNDAELLALKLRIEARLFPDDPDEIARNLQRGLPMFVQQVEWQVASIQKGLPEQLTHDVAISEHRFFSLKDVRGRHDYGVAIQQLEQKFGCRMALTEVETSFGELKYAVVRVYLHEAPEKMAS